MLHPRLSSHQQTLLFLWFLKQSIGILGEDRDLAHTPSQPLTDPFTNQTHQSNTAATAHLTTFSLAVTQSDSDK